MSKNNNIEVKLVDWFDDHFYKIRYTNDQKLDVEEYFPSVTTKLQAIAKPNLISWYGDIGNREANLRLDEASDRGSRIHKAWEVITQAGVVIYDPIKFEIYTKEEKEELINRHGGNHFILRKQEEMWQAMKLYELYKRLSPESVISETIVYDIDRKEAGTADNIMTIKEGEYEINGATPLKLKGQYIVDLKTGNYIHEENKMQVSAYAKFAEKMGMDEINGAIIVHTNSKNRKGIEGLGCILIEKEELDGLYNDYKNIAKIWDRHFSRRKPRARQIPGYLSI